MFVCLFFFNINGLLLYLNYFIFCLFAKIRWVCKVQSLGKHKNGWVKKKYSLGSGETKFPLGRGKKSTGSGSTGSGTEGCYSEVFSKILFKGLEAL